MLTIHQIINNPVPSNCFVVFDKEVGRDCIIVDPGSEDDEELFAYIDEYRLEPRYIILTHEHFDHCWGVNELVERYNIPIVCSALCADNIKKDKKNCSAFYDLNKRFTINTTNIISVESFGCEMPFAETMIHFLITPGHTDAGICFCVGNSLFTGDTLIKDLKTVTKLPTGSVSKVKETINEMAKLKGHGFVVYAGHGDSFSLDEYDINKAI